MNSVKFPPAVVKRAQDAARAVKRKGYQVVQLVLDESLTMLLDLPHFAVRGIAIETDAAQDILHLHCELTVEAAVCPCCQGISTAVKSTKDRCVRDLDGWNKRTFVHFAIRRFECPECGHRFYERLRAVSPQRRQTNRFEEKCTNVVSTAARKGLPKPFIWAIQRWMASSNGWQNDTYPANVRVVSVCWAWMKSPSRNGISSLH